MSRSTLRPTISFSAVLLAAGLFTTAPTNASPTDPQATPDTTADQPAQQQPATATPAAEAAPETLDASQIPEVVARVNDEEIHRQELLESAREAAANLQDSDSPRPPATRQFYQQVLDSLINRELLVQAATESGVQVSQADVDQQISTLEDRAPSPEAFDSALEQQGLTREDLAASIRQNLVVNQYIESQIAPSIQVNEEEERALYEEHREELKRPEQVKVRHILVSVAQDDGEAAKETARQEAESLRQQLVDGAEFAQLAQENSDDTGSGQRGGELPWISRGQTVQPFEQAAFGLEPGTLSEVIETRFGYHILEVQDHREAGTLAFEDAKPRLNQILKRQKLQQAVLAEVEGLEAQAEIERNL